MISGNFETNQEIPFASHGYSDIYRRDWDGGKVAVKALRFHLDDDGSERMKVTTVFIDDNLGNLPSIRNSTKKYCCGNV